MGILRYIYGKRKRGVKRTIENENHMTYIECKFKALKYC
jgi:hypothetical protein